MRSAAGKTQQGPSGGRSLRWTTATRRVVYGVGGAAAAESPGIGAGGGVIGAAVAPAESADARS